MNSPVKESPETDRSVAWMTDLHFDFLKRDAFTTFLLQVKANTPETILIAGDIGQANSFADYLLEMDELLQCPIYFVLGNHDYYHGSFMA